MPNDRYLRFGKKLADWTLKSEPALSDDSQLAYQLHATNKNGEVFNLDLRPFAAKPVGVSGMTFFGNIRCVSGLLSAYQSARQSLPFEMDSESGRAHVSDYANDFLAAILARGNAALNNDQAQLIGNWVKNLDVYAAVKAVESFLYGDADLKLLEVGHDFGWDITFDHMAIRCGSREHGDAERVANLLKESHGYVSAQMPNEASYQFNDGWSAYALYKMLSNGQVLRIFVDQSDEDQPHQIIQHWNHVYGYTAHHLGFRATVLLDGVRHAVPLPELMGAMGQAGVTCLSPTGHYTEGLLEQVFTQPELDRDIPPSLISELALYGEGIAQVIGNAKLLELVSRKEMPPGLAAKYFAMYGVQYEADNGLHSAPVYQYFLPAQAAHVIRTSQHIARTFG